MKQTVIGSYRLGPHAVQLVLREDDGGEFYLVPESGHAPRIKVGADHKDWGEMVSVLHHEAMELAMTMTGVRYQPAPDFANDHGAYLFVMTHAQFSEAGARTGRFLSDCLPDLARAWKKWRK